VASVLVVDDDSDFRAAICAILVDEGYAVRSAANGAEALERIAEETPDVLLLDLVMPVMNGWELLRSLREASLAIPVVVISALADRSAPYQIAKPVSLDQLLKLVDALAAGRAPSGKWWFGTEKP
jgi:CheY-like chemotaxis protein